MQKLTFRIQINPDPNGDIVNRDERAMLTTRLTNLLFKNFGPAAIVTQPVTVTLNGSPRTFQQAEVVWPTTYELAAELAVTVAEALGRNFSCRPVEVEIAEVDRGVVWVDKDEHTREERVVVTGFEGRSDIKSDLEERLVTADEVVDEYDFDDDDDDID